jgi:hypothetical protein
VAGVDPEPRRYFTVAEAERLIPRLESIMGAAMDAHKEAARLRAELQDAQRQVMLAGGARLDQEFWRSRKARFDRATGAIQRGLGEIVKLGGAPKDVGLGLVDFLTRLETRDVNLCWRFGEKRIRFWHGLDEGFGARKPWPEVTEGPD